MSARIEMSLYDTTKQVCETSPWTTFQVVHEIWKCKRRGNKSGFTANLWIDQSIDLGSR